MHGERILTKTHTSLFCTPVVEISWGGMENLNRSLEATILARAEREPSMHQSNKGGWQSSRHLHDWDSEDISRLLGMVNLGLEALRKFLCLSEIVRDPTITAWANVNSFSDYNGLHNHSGSVWSGVYYVSCDSPRARESQEGALSFRNPTLAPLTVQNLNPPLEIVNLFKPSHTVQPKEGLMLLFPSWLEHYVHPFFGAGKRISVAWDVAYNRP